MAQLPDRAACGIGPPKGCDGLWVWQCAWGWGAMRDVTGWESYEVGSLSVCNATQSLIVLVGRCVENLAKTHFGKMPVHLRFCSFPEA